MPRCFVCRIQRGRPAAGSHAPGSPESRLKHLHKVNAGFTLVDLAVSGRPMLGYDYLVQSALRSTVYAEAAQALCRAVSSMPWLPCIADLVMLFVIALAAGWCPSFRFVQSHIFDPTLAKGSLLEVSLCLAWFT